VHYTAKIRALLVEAKGNQTLAAQKLCAAAENDLALYQALTRPFLASAAALAVRQAIQQEAPAIKTKRTTAPASPPSPDGVPWEMLLERIASTSPLSPEQQAKNLRHVAKAFMVQRYAAYAQNPSVKTQ
jgi:hypothetical protein